MPENTTIQPSKQRPLLEISQFKRVFKLCNATMTLVPESPIVHYVLQLPVEITRSIFNEYLKGEYKNKYALLQTTEKFHLLRKQIIYLKLALSKGKKFYLNNEYRERVLSCIENPQYQLHLDLDYLNAMRKDWPTSIDLSVVLPVHQLTIYYFPKIDNFHLIGTYKLDLLDIVDCDSSIDIEVCKGISTLFLGNCSKIENIDKFWDIKICSLRSCSVNPSDWSIFSSLQVFELTECESITDKDVSALAHIRDLTLKKCSNITNIDLLTHNDKLSICDCPGIKTISLSDHPREEVNIARSSKLVGLTIAGKVGKVNLNFLSRLFDISLLNCVKKLTIVEADSLIRLNNLKYVQSISLLTCNQLVELSTLLQAKSLEINECQSLLSIRSLQYLDRLTICSAGELQFIEDLPLLRSLEIDDCQNLAKLTNLPFCKDYEFNVFFGKLEVVNCPGYVERDDL